MAFEYKINLNGEVLEATLGATVVDKLEEPLDEGALNIPITVLKKQHKMLGLLEIEVFDKQPVCNFVGVSTYEANSDETNTSQSCGFGATRTVCVQDPFDPLIWSCQIQNAQITYEIASEKKFSYLIISDTVSVASKDLLYKHDLSAIEYTHKLDKYLINTLTFTKPFRRKVLAPFDVDFPQVGTGTSTTFTSKFYIEPLFVNQTYNLNETLVIKQKNQGYIKYTLDDANIRKDLFIKVYKPNAVTPVTNHNITNSDLTITFDEVGIWKISYGIIDYLTNEESVYTFYTQVFREQKYTLYDMLVRVRAAAPLETQDYFEITRIFNIDPELEEYFKRIEMPQMFIQKQTVRQVLNTMFKYINAISRLKHIGYESTDILTIDEFNKVIGEFSENEIVDFESEQNAESYGSKAISWLAQSLQDNFRDNASIKTPAQGRFKTVRAKGIQLTRTEDGFVLKLEKPIYEISKFSVFIPEIELGSFRQIGGKVTEIVENLELDLTPRVLNKTEWALKNNTVNFPNYTIPDIFSSQIGLRKNKAGNIYWEQGKSEIDFSEQVGDWFAENIIITTVNEALREYYTLNIPFVLDGSEVLMERLGYDPLYISELGNNLFRNIGFNIEYVTFDDPTFQADRADVSDLNYYSELRVNQQSRQTNFGLASRNTYGQLQRSAVPINTFSKIHTSLDDLYEVGMIDDEGFIITQRSITFYNEHLEATYQATKDHNRIAEFIGVSQEYRVFEIPRGNNIYDRRDFYNDYLYITSPTQIIPDNPTMIKDVDKFARRIYKRETGPTKVTFGIVRTDGMKEIYPDEITPNRFYGIMTPINSYGGKGGVQFNFSFPNNQVAGDALTKEGSNYFNDPIRYTDTQGFFDTISFGFSDIYQPTLDFEKIFPDGTALFNDVDEVNANKEYKYPLVKSELSTFNQDYTISSDSPLIVYKDASSTYGLTYQVSILPFDYNNYVIGQAFYTDNRAVVNAEFDDAGVDVSPKMYLYKYKTSATRDYTYRIFDDLIVKDEFPLDYDKVELVEGVTINYNTSTKTMTFLGGAIITSSHKGWAIGNEDGDLYIACNKALNGFAFSRQHFRINITEIGRLEPLFDKGRFARFTQPIQFSIDSKDYSGIVINRSISIIKDLEQRQDAWVTADFDLQISVTVDDEVYQGVVESKNLIITTSLEPKQDAWIDEQTTVLISSSVIDFVHSESVIKSLSISTDLDLGQDAWIDKQTNVIIISNVSQFSNSESISKNLLISTDIELTQDAWIDKQTNILITKTLSQFTHSESLSKILNVITSGERAAIKWVEGGTSQTANTTCEILADEGNVRQVQEFSCTWVSVSTYLTSQNETDTSQACDTGNTRIICFQDPFDPSIWGCTLFEPDVTPAIYQTCTVIGGNMS